MIDVIESGERRDFTGGINDYGDEIHNKGDSCLWLCSINGGFLVDGLLSGPDLIEYRKYR